MRVAALAIATNFSAYPPKCFGSSTESAPVLFARIETP